MARGASIKSIKQEFFQQGRELIFALMTPGPTSASRALVWMWLVLISRRAIAPVLHFAWGNS
jgi:hypothetical protein